MKKRQFALNHGLVLEVLEHILNSGQCMRVCVVVVRCTQQVYI